MFPLCKIVFDTLYVLHDHSTTFSPVASKKCVFLIEHLIPLSSYNHVQTARMFLWCHFTLWPVRFGQSGEEVSAPLPGAGVQLPQAPAAEPWRDCRSHVSYSAGHAARQKIRNQAFQKSYSSEIREHMSDAQRAPLSEKYQQIARFPLDVRNCSLS